MALIDADLLAAVFVELKGGRQPDLELDEHMKDELSTTVQLRIQIYPGHIE